MVAAMSKEIKQEFGYLGLFLIISAWGAVALLATLIYPKNPSPISIKKKKSKKKKTTEDQESDSVIVSTEKNNGIET